MDRGCLELVSFSYPYFDNENALFIGNICTTVSDLTLKEELGKYGLLHSLTCKRNKLQEARGCRSKQKCYFAIANIYSKHEATNIIREAHNKRLHGVPICVKQYKARSQRSGYASKVLPLPKCIELINHFVSPFFWETKVLSTNLVKDVSPSSTERAQAAADKCIYRCKTVLSITISLGPTVSVTGSAECKSNEDETCLTKRSPVSQLKALRKMTMSKAYQVAFSKFFFILKRGQIASIQAKE
eukprot:Nk52_evm22s270 gene=Nk52_evmTU22s270